MVSCVHAQLVYGIQTVELRSKQAPAQCLSRLWYACGQYGQTSRLKAAQNAHMHCMAHNYIASQFRHIQAGWGWAEHHTSMYDRL